MGRFLVFMCALLVALPGLADPPALVHAGDQADLVTLDKSERRLVLWRAGRVLKRYRVALGFAPEGHKSEEGDGKTPEGRYVLDWKNSASKFHLSIHVSYPNDNDTAQARARHVSPGGDIFIHGQPGGTGWLLSLPHDWTLGCIAVSNVAIEEIWSLVPVGTPIEITP